MTAKAKAENKGHAIDLKESMSKKLARLSMHTKAKAEKRGHAVRLKDSMSKKLARLSKHTQAEAEEKECAMHRNTGARKKGKRRTDVPKDRHLHHNSLMKTTE